MGLFDPNITRLRRKGDIPGLLKCLEHRKGQVRYRAFIALGRQAKLSDDAIAKMKTMLDDPDERVRTVTTLKFVELGVPLDAGNLRDLMKNGTKREKFGLLRIIAGRGTGYDDAIMEAIVLALADSKPIIRLEAIKTAGATRSSHLTHEIARFLRSPHSAVRIQIVEALGEIADDMAIDYLIGLLADPDTLVQKEARNRLERIDSERIRRALHDTAYMELIRGLGGREPERRDTARKIGLGKIRECMPLLYTACRDPFKEVRLEAVRALTVFADPQAVDVMANLLDDRFYDVRLEAVRALAKTGGEKAMNALTRSLCDRNRKVREEAGRVLQANPLT